jgi:DNA-binding GntR family transcriptional regulator
MPKNEPAAAAAVAAGDLATRLRGLIFDRTLPAGSRIDQWYLAQRFNVSVEQVREALLQLQAARLVRLVPPRGAFVEELSSDEFEEIYRIREVLEEHAARLAAPLLTAEDLRKLDQLEKELIALAEAGDVDRSLALHRELHFTIYKATGHHHLLHFIEQLWKLSSRFRHLQIHASPDRIREALSEIRAIVSACRRRDAEALGFLVRFKVQQTRAGLHERLRASSATSTNDSPSLAQFGEPAPATQTAEKSPQRLSAASPSIRPRASVRAPSRPTDPPADARGSGKRRTAARESPK